VMCCLQLMLSVCLSKRVYVPSSSLFSSFGGAENARLENAGLELSAPNCRGGKCETGIIGNRKRMERYVWHNLFVTVCTVIGISTWYTYEHRVIPAHLSHGQCRN